MIRKPIVHRVNRNRRDPSAPPSGTFATCTVTLTGSKMRVVASTPLVVTGVPTTFRAAATSGGAVTQTATAISVVSPTTIDVSFTTGPVTGAGWLIGLNDPAVRSSQGGFLVPATGTF